MMIYYTLVFFTFGMVLGSFYNVVGYRLPKEESIVFPGSHCPKCNHKLGISELIPIFSYIFLNGKCKICQEKISCFYAIFELITAFLFALSYLLIGLEPELLIALTVISVFVIIVVSDIHYMVIPDEVLLIGIIFLLIEMVIIKGIVVTSTFVIGGTLSFLAMYLLKFIGDFCFKKESLGGGDIKLMFLIGLILDWPLAIVTIILSAFIAFPIAIFNVIKNKEDILPFGPYLALAATILFLSGITISDIINIFII